MKRERKKGYSRKWQEAVWQGQRRTVVWGLSRSADIIDFEMTLMWYKPVVGKCVEMITHECTSKIPPEDSRRRRLTDQIGHYDSFPLIDDLPNVLTVLRPYSSSTLYSVLLDFATTCNP